VEVGSPTVGEPSGAGIELVSWMTVGAGTDGSADSVNGTGSAGR
jgi:hypothetical protein